MADRPRLSVVVPVRDDAPALRRCLAALGAQTEPAFEVVVVDNGSRDDGAAVAAAHGARVVTEPVRGIPAAAAAGYDAARGDVVVRLDADTVVPPDLLARVADAFAADPALDALTGTGRFYDVGPVRAAVVGRLYLAAYYVLMHAAMAHPPLWGSAMAVRRDAWVGVRHLVHLDPEIHDDADLAFALGPTATIRYDPSLVVDVSGRSLVGAHQTSRRFARAFRTLALSWRRIPPWTRWAMRLRAAPTP
ncbi:MULTISPECIES: glycosyltransferase family 2 protein [unclassified Actinotalea]|uniref:glycosyltransferase family 2 protein n=1 Tax=unclassified Actinotalea TaxID=2638618 RepID=UPI0015F663D9|nr:MULTISPECIES: glycosyltransferase family 2 protein [unclassified Actinotalea]